MKNQSSEWVYCDEFYGAKAVKNNKTGNIFIGLDGACGFSSIERIANAIGIKIKWNPESNRYKNHEYYIAIES